MSTKKKRGPKPRPNGTTTSKSSGRRNVTLAREDADRLNTMQDHLEKRFGFRPTLSQTVSWLIQAHPLTEAPPHAHQGPEPKSVTR